MTMTENDRIYTILQTKLSDNACIPMAGQMADSPRRKHPEISISHFSIVEMRTWFSRMVLPIDQIKWLRGHFLPLLKAKMRGAKCRLLGRNGHFLPSFLQKSKKNMQNQGRGKNGIQNDLREKQQVYRRAQIKGRRLTRYL